MKWTLLIRTSLLVIAWAGVARAAGPSSANAGSFYVDGTFFPVFGRTNQTGSIGPDTEVAPDRSSGYDLRLTGGYLWRGNYLLGVSYNLYSQHDERDPVAGGDSGSDKTTSKNELGATVGYVTTGWRVLFTYFLSGSKKEKTINKDSAGETTGDSSTTYSNVSGYQLLIGYGFVLSGRLELGPSLLYRSVTYEKQSHSNALQPAEDYSDTTLKSKNIEDNLTPMISIMYRF